MSLTAWSVYWLATVKILWPFCILMFRSGAESPGTPQGIGYMALALSLMTVGMYLHVIFCSLRSSDLGYSAGAAHFRAHCISFFIDKSVMLYLNT